MHGIEELKDKLCEELETYGKKELTAGSLDVVDKLAHAVKNLDKIIESDDYSNGYMMRGGSYRGGSYEGGSSRGGSYEGYSRRRDRMGRYSRDGGLREKLEEIMQEVPEHMRGDIQRLMDKV